MLQLRQEGKVRAELESMISRIEAHFKKEQAARKRAEEQLAQAAAEHAALAAERDALAAQLESERMQQVRQGLLSPPEALNGQVPGKRYA